MEAYLKMKADLHARKEALEAMELEQARMREEQERVIHEMSLKMGREAAEVRKFENDHQDTKGIENLTTNLLLKLPGLKITSVQVRAMIGGEVSINLRLLHSEVAKVAEAFRPLASLGVSITNIKDRYSNQSINITFPQEHLEEVNIGLSLGLGIAISDEPRSFAAC